MDGRIECWLCLESQKTLNGQTGYLSGLHPPFTQQWPGQAPDAPWPRKGYSGLKEWMEWKCTFQVGRCVDEDAAGPISDTLCQSQCGPPGPGNPPRYRWCTPLLIELENESCFLWVKQLNISNTEGWSLLRLSCWRSWLCNSGLLPACVCLHKYTCKLGLQQNKKFDSLLFFLI